MVDELVAARDMTGARQFMEQGLLPTVARFKLLDHVVKVRGQYAVVLARCGNVNKAREKVARLGVFAASSERDRLVLETQGQLVKAVSEHGRDFALGPVPDLRGEVLGQKLIVAIRSKQRLDLCRCGSSKKARNCCRRGRTS